MSPVQRPARDQIRVFESAAAFRRWLEENHDTADELFVGFYRNGVPIKAMTYAEAVDEALCFGWIDGIAFGIDGELRAQRFTPRRRTSSWSAVNIAKIEALRAAGRLHPAGLRAFEERDRRKDQVYSYERPPTPLPDEWLDRFRANAAGWSYWERQPPSYRRAATHWVMTAVKPETRERRFTELLETSAAGTRPRPFLVARAERKPGD